MTKLLQDAELRQPQPQMSCKECMSFKSMQSFDIVALIESVSERRLVSPRKFVRDVCILDGTTDGGVSSPAQIVCPKISVFYQTSSSGHILDTDPAHIQQLIEAAGQPRAFSFIGLQAQGHNFQTMRTWYKIAPSQGAKAEKLRTDHEAIMKSKQLGTVIILEKKWSPDANDGEWRNSLGQETLCAHLETMSKRTGLAALDEKTSVWQANWVFPCLMHGTHVTTAGDKLWVHILCQDVSGRVEARMNEKIALAISGRASKEDFLQAVAEGDAVFPSILSLKFARTIKEVQSEGDFAEKQTFVNTTVIAACAQDLTMPRTTTVKQLVPILRSLTTISTAILPAALNMLKSSVAYPLQVQYPVPDMDSQPCQKVWVLIKATKKSKCTDVFPYSVTTDDVQDVLQLPQLGVTPPTAEQSLSVSPPKYKLLSICSKEARTSLTLTPSHGKHVFALAVITSVQDNILCAESVETIQKDDKDKLSMIMQQEMALAVDLIKHASGGTPTPWTDTTSPLTAASCRVLGKSPSGPELEAIEAHTGKKARFE